MGGIAILELRKSSIIYLTSPPPPRQLLFSDLLDFHMGKSSLLPSSPGLRARFFLLHAPPLVQHSRRSFWPARAVSPAAAERTGSCSVVAAAAAVPARSDAAAARECPGGPYHRPPARGGSCPPRRTRLGDPAGLRRRRAREPERRAGLDPEVGTPPAAPVPGPTHPGRGDRGHG